MRYIKTIKLFYLVYTIYSILIFLISDYQFMHLILGLCSIWMTYLFFIVGYKTISGKDINKVYDKQKPGTLSFIRPMREWNFWMYFLNMLVCWACAVMAAKFYTGKGFLHVLTNMLGSGNAYYSYQLYFKDQGLASFTFAKIPYILMLTYLTLSLFWSFMALAVNNPKISLIQYLYLGFIALAYYYFGASRGTNFEMYLIFITLVYSIFNRQTGHSSKQIMKTAVAGLLGVVLVFLFRLVVSGRGVSFSNTICSEISYAPESLMAQLFRN